MTSLNSPPATRLKIAVRGAVQGVGFRPFVHRLAAELGLAGWVNNSSQGVFIEAEGPRASLDQFLLRLQTEKPPRSFIQSLESWWLDAAGYAGFEIRPSETGGGKTAIIMPDLATCPDCLREIFDPAQPAASVSRSPTAPIAGRASRLWSRSLTIAPTPR